MTATDLGALKERAIRAHRMSCSDPDDPTCETPYSVQLKLIAALEAVEGKLRVLDAFVDGPTSPCGRHKTSAAGAASVIRKAIRKAIREALQ